MLRIGKQQARRYLLAHQGLYPPQGLAGAADALRFIRRVGCIQFDPLNVVGRNPDLVLQSRIADYSAPLLESLLYQERKLVDGWDKMMAIFPVEDWPLFSYRREAARKRPRHSAEVVEAVLPRVRQALRERGPLSSIDLDHDQVVEWSWAPTRLARAALDCLFDRGEVIVHHKVGTRKVYDLVERHIARELLETPNPFSSNEQLYDWYMLRRMRGIGMLWAGFAGSLAGPGFKRKARDATLARLVAQGDAVMFAIEGIDQPFYIPTDLLPALEANEPPDKDAPAALLAPLDNLLWDRRMLEAIFDFYYRWEVYTPVAKRQYGYYVLPVVWGDRIVGRCEPVRDKKTGALRIKNWWWERDVTLTPALGAAVDEGLRRFGAYLDAEALCFDDPVKEALGR